VRIINYDIHQSEQGALFFAVLKDLQKREFKCLTQLQLFHSVYRVTRTIRTIAYEEDGLHFAIRRLTDQGKLKVKHVYGVEADFMLVGMEVKGFDIEPPESSSLEDPLLVPSNWTGRYYLPTSDVITRPVKSHDVARISRVIADTFLQRLLVAEIDIIEELREAYPELVPPAINFNEWE
jgi:hypothetical protein